MDAQALDGVYTEAMWFVAVFVSMSIVSFFVSRRNARKFEIENPIDVRLAKIQKEKEHIQAKNKRETELSLLYKDNLISSKEFKLLVSNLDNLVT